MRVLVDIIARILTFSAMLQIEFRTWTRKNRFNQMETIVQQHKELGIQASSYPIQCIYVRMTLE